ncbi:MAG: redoxin domain-containing protein [Candidatus Dadabacteria bacterium]|nr:redoxin domain-containing protein [Candidatus Dadabacteria bacterium]NIQ13884.1 redoxin domain-containing protein [Candidatus Dadabacteria bacterium]
MSENLKVGQNAPDFEAETYNGEKVKLSDYYNNSIVALYFYPKDNTPGCTKEACSLRDGNNELKNMNVQVVGVSTDGVKAHENFRDKYDLKFPLLSDKSRDIINTYGIKSKYNSAKRVTFLIDKGGEIKHIWTKVNTSEHAQEVINKVKELGL